MLSPAVLLGASLLVSQPKPDVSPHRSEDIIANGVRLNYLDWGGKGETIIFLAGSGDNPHAFDDLAPKLTNRFHVLGLTRRGFGDSQRDVRDFDAVTLSKDLRAFMDIRGIRRTHLIGHSAAGDELTQFTIDTPDRVLKLVYLDAAYDRRSLVEIEKLNPIPDAEPTNERLRAHWAALDAYHPNFRALRVPILSIYAKFESHWAITPDTDPELKEQANKFVIDVVQPYQMANVKAFRRAVPHAEIELLTGTHHYFFQDPKYSDWTVKRIQRFLTQK